MTKILQLADYFKPTNRPFCIYVNFIDLRKKSGLYYFLQVFLFFFNLLWYKRKRQVHCPSVSFTKIFVDHIQKEFLLYSVFEFSESFASCKTLKDNFYIRRSYIDFHFVKRKLLVAHCLSIRTVFLIFSIGFKNLTPLMNIKHSLIL